jgi:hypothetical protein
MKSKIFGIFAAAFGLAAIVHAFYAYFMRSFDPATRQMFDGYGRDISPAPFPFSLVYSSADGAWPGFGWMAVDWIAFFCLIFLAIRFFRMSTSQTKVSSGDSRSI